MIKLNYDELTAANILGISYTDAGKDEIKLGFDQTVTWKEERPIIWSSNNIAALTFCDVPIHLPED